MARGLTEGVVPAQPRTPGRTPAAAVLLIRGYLGYAGVLAAVGASAAINLR